MSIASRPAAARWMLLLLALASPLSLAAEAAKRPITAQDLWAAKRLSAPALSPDGRTAAYSVQEWSIEKNKPSASLWLTEVESGTTRRLTQGSSSDGQPAWSPDGRRLAFVSKRGEDEAASLYVIAVDGGEAEELVELPYGVSNPQWMPDGQSIVVVTQVIPELAGTLAKEDLAAIKKEMKRRKDSKMTAYVTEHRQYRFFDKNLTDNLAHRLVKVTLATKALTDLTPKQDRLFHMSSPEVRYEIAPDGQHIALALNSSPPPYSAEPNQDIVLLATDGSGTLRNLTADNPRSDDEPRFAPDGKSLYFLRQVLPTPAGELRRLWRHDLRSGENRLVSGGIDLSIDEIAFSADGRTLWFQAEQQGVVPIFRLRADGSGLTRLYAEGSSTGLRAAGGRVVFLNDTTSRPAELHALDPRSGEVRRLTRFNDALIAGLDLGKVESHTFSGAGGARVQLWLAYPPGYDPARKYPLLQLLHGGPHTMVRDSFGYRWNPHVFASPGYIVSWVNRHGSTGFGEAFARSINGAWGDKPMEDILKANAYLFEKIPAIDRDKVAAAGASYGGYLATWMLGHTTAFKTLVNHAGVSDFIGQYGADITTYFFNAEVLGGTPWDDLEGMQRNNPIIHARNFKTPMLILHGELDYRVPYGQGIALYGVLQSMGVPSRLVMFPNENHWILSPQNAIYWNYEVQSWLARYIGGQPMAKPSFDAPEPAAK
ncbi:MAG TPA: S9 family peptidase [Nevskiaceae bacterium]|nr:S9 family peptidase [Nevskiaceae bacterium]